MDECLDCNAQIIMHVKRLFSRCLYFWQDYLKKCCFRRVITILGTLFLCWSTFLMFTTPFLLRFERKGLTRFSIRPQNLSNQKTAFNVDDWTVNKNPFMYEDLVQENPLGTYFSDRLGGYTPVGSSHLDFYRREYQQPLKMVLIFVESMTSASVVQLGKFFAQQRIEYRIRDVTMPLPPLVLGDTGVARYSLFVFEDYVNYLGMSMEKKTVLDNYCKRYQVGILALVGSAKNSEIEFFPNQKIKLQHRMKLYQFKLNPESEIWRVAKVQEVYSEVLPSFDWTVFRTTHASYQPLVFSTVTQDWQGLRADVSTAEFGCVIAVHDQGHLDGIERIILGYDLDFWLNSIVAMDAVTHLTGGRLSLPLTRLLQVDIDDMFVGVTGIRTQVKDAMAMLESQKKIQELVPEFTYKLGFSGEFFLKGNPNEQDGDRKIVELAAHFDWFNHMFRHEQPHMFDQQRLDSSMDKNDRFAQESKLPVIQEYMVTPHHSGVYPVYEALYNVWLERGVLCTSTTEYPNQVPVWNRKGFIYRGVMVLPRQICNLFTTINRFEDYHGGKLSLDNSIKGDFLFKLFLYTPVLIFMTHMSNYANDQLAEYTFENVISFVTKWTNLKILAPPPLEIGRRYFEIYPNEITPLWTNPCNSNKHLEVLPPHVSCSKFPSFIIVGPQKSGSTALQKFLEAHPMLVSTVNDPAHFEEVQFFSGVNYHYGLDWYQNHFPEPVGEQTLLFEKSANYFENEITPKRVVTLLPKVKVIVILANPIRRAYSWYQHIRWHQDPVAMNYTFFEVISAPDTAPKFLRDTRSKCLRPGAYAIHLARWLQFFPADQIYLVDGEELSKNPVPVMNKLQAFLEVAPYVDFATKLWYEPTKGFYCRVDTGCLGGVKGRKYDPMDLESRRYLENYFTDHNTNLKILLNDIGRDYPKWLAETSSN